MKRAGARVAIAAFAFAAMLAGACPSNATTAAAGSPWIAISDVHYGPRIGGKIPSPLGSDTNLALLNSLFADLRAHDPDPPVVIIAGDFLAHHFRLDQAGGTMIELARRFDALYPHSQFLITLGNNDSACGDYAPPIGGAFLASVARAWAPLVDRNGAAPNFARSFARDGSYVARLPIAHLRAVAIDDVGLSIRASASCASGRNLGAAELGDLAHDLAALPRGDGAWLLFHIPPGIDAASTFYTHRVAAIPFMRPGARHALENEIRLRARISLVIAGHTHKFAYRIVPGMPSVPVLLVPSISPIFGNRPSYLELGVAGDGTISSVRQRAYGGAVWRSIGSLAQLGLRRFEATDLRALQIRLRDDAALRERFAVLYEGGATPEITQRNWPLFWCAATELGTSEYAACTASLNLPLRTFGAAGIALLFFALVGLAVVVVLRARARGPISLDARSPK